MNNITHVKSNNVNPKWQMKLDKGFYPNPFYEYVKDNFRRLYEAGYKDKQSLYTVFYKELYEYGKELDYDDKRIQHYIDKYSFPSLDKYWFPKYKVR